MAAPWFEGHCYDAFAHPRRMLRAPPITSSMREGERTLGDLGVASTAPPPMLGPAPDVQYGLAKPAYEMIRYFRRQNVGKVVKRPGHHSCKLMCRNVRRPPTTQFQTALSLLFGVHNPQSNTQIERKAPSWGWGELTDEAFHAGQVVEVKPAHTNADSHWPYEILTRERSEVMCSLCQCPTRHPPQHGGGGSKISRPRRRERRP